MSNNTAPSSEVGREVWVHPDELRPHPENPNTKHDVLGIARSIQDKGFVDPIVAQNDGTILSGHGRWMAARHLSLTSVPVIRVTMTPSQALEYMVAANRLAEASERDEGALVAIFEKLHSEHGRSMTELSTTGYDVAAIESLLGLAAGNPHGAPDADEDPGPPPLTPQTVPGELIQLGPHRVFCGDSTDPESWRKLLEGDTRGLDGVFCDPPYGIDYESNQGKQKKAKIANDGTVSEAVRVTRDALLLAKSHCVDGAPAYVCCGGGGERNALGPMWDILNEVGKVTNLLVWDKRETKGLGWRWRFSWEGIFELLLTGSKFAVWQGGRSLGNVLRHNKVIPKSGDHPTPKPVPLIVEVLDAAFPRGALVADCFGGSGTTLIAAARLGCVARIIEMDPGYCDLIRLRWARLQAQGVHHGVRKGPRGVQVQ